MRRLRIFPVVVVVLLLSGCPRDAYRAAIQGSDDVASAVHASIKVTASYYSNGTFNDADKAVAGKYFTVVTDCNMSFRKAVVAAHNSGQTVASAFLPVANSFVSCVKNSVPVTTDHPKVVVVLQAIDTTIGGIVSAINQAKGK